MEKVRFDERVFKSFLENHDLVYEKPAKIWDKGIPMANSLISALVWGEDHLNVTMNRLDVWEMRRYQTDPEKFTWRYYTKLLEEGKGDELEGIAQRTAGPSCQQLPIGRFEVNVRGIKFSDYHMRLGLYDAISEGGFTTEYGSLKWKCHVSALHPVILFSYSTTGDEKVAIHFRFCSRLGEYAADFEKLRQENPARAGGKVLNGSGKLIRGYKKIPELAQILKDWGYPDPSEGVKDDISWYEQQIPENGSYAIAWKDLCISQTDTGESHVLIVSIEQNSEKENARIAAIENVKLFLPEETRAQEEREHRDWWHRFYPGSFYSISDTRLEALYWINLYKLGCETRREGIAPPMCGPWQPDDGAPEFLGNTYVWNTQQQVNLFGIYTANRLELAMSTYDMLVQNRQKMADFAKNFFEVDGEFLPHMTDWKLGCPNFTPDHFELISGPWMCQLMWKHYQYSLDQEFLKDTLFPLMKAQCRTIMSLLEEWEDKKYHFRYTYSAEYPPNNSGKEKQQYSNRFGPDATCDLAYTRFMCETLLESVNILGIHDEDEERWRDVQERLAEPALDEYGGLMVRRDQALVSSHRHLTHLFPITQLYQITYEDENQRNIIEKSLHVLKLRGTGEWEGWTFSETAKIAIIAHQPAMAYSLLHDYSDHFIQENTFDCDGSNNDCAFTIHGNMGLTLESDGMFNEALQNFAVRSFNGCIYVMDVLPESWRDMSFYHFRTEGAFLISAQRRDGVTEFISVYSEAGKPATICSCFKTDVNVYCNGYLIPYKIMGNRIEFETIKGKEYILMKKGAKAADFNITPVEPQKHEVNFYGVKYSSRY